MAGMPDQDDFAAAPKMNFGLAMHFGDERAGRIDRDQVAAAGVDRHRSRHPMGGENDRDAGVRYFVEFLDEDGALLAQAIHHIAVMDDLMADIDGLAIDGERLLDGVDRPHHAGTKAAGRT